MKKVLVHRVHPTGREVRIVEERIGAVTWKRSRRAMVLDHICTSDRVRITYTVEEQP